MKIVRSILVGIVTLGLAGTVATGCAERPGKKKDDDKADKKKDETKAKKKD